VAGAESSRERAAFVLAGVRVAVTRPAGGADTLGRALEAEGAEVLRLPLIRIEPTADPAELGNALRAPPDWDWLVFTSANAVATFVAGAPLASVRGRVAAVGPATAAAVAAAGGRVTVVPEEQRAEAIVAAMAAEGPLRGLRVLWPRAAQAGGGLRERLTAAGALLHEVELYRTVEDAAAGRALSDRVERGELDVVTFTSPSAVRAFMAGSGGGGRTAVVAVIGPVTAAAARAAGLRVAVEAPVPTPAAMVGALRAFYERGADGEGGR
jgi:uroporphyrinogen-III synthase